MALKTAGTNANNTLQALQWQPAGLVQADLAALSALIKGLNGAIVPNDLHNGILKMPSGRSPAGLIINPGDWICVDASGYPIIIPNANFGVSWTHN